MAEENPTWGEERIANELRLKLGLAVSPRTVGRYLRPVRPGVVGPQSRRWTTYNRGRPHASLGPGIPQPVPDADQLASTGHRLPRHTEVIATPILGGLHPEYRLARRAA